MEISGFGIGKAKSARHSEQKLSERRSTAQNLKVSRSTGIMTSTESKIIDFPGETSFSNSAEGALVESFQKLGTSARSQRRFQNTSGTAETRAGNAIMASRKQRLQLEWSEKNLKSANDFAMAKGFNQESEPLEPASKRGTQSVVKKALRMKRAKKWCPQVEENFRLQGAGWKDIHDYSAVYGEPERWASTGHPRCVRVKENGFYMYWGEQPECESKYLNKVKIYEYAGTA